MIKKAKIIMIKKTKIIFIHILGTISRFIMAIIPYEFRPKLINPINQMIEDETNKTIFKTFKEVFKTSLLFKDQLTIQKYAIETSLFNNKNNEYDNLEFGVWNGLSANLFSKYVKKLYAFDSFEGLEEDWGGKDLQKGTFNLNKKIPQLNSNVELVVGLVKDTLEDFLKKNNPKINFVHLDMDTYTPTKYTLERIKPYLVKDAIILFDQLYNYPGWEYGEYKALIEVFKPEEYIFKAIAINKYEQAVIQIKIQKQD